MRISKSLFAMLLGLCFLSAKSPEKPDDLLTSRFIVVSDESIDRVAGISFPNGWWSRPYEYAWAAHFAGSDFEVLDAACGVSHPFKWLLGMNCKKTWACDLDPRIIDRGLLMKEILDDLGRENYNVLVKNPGIIDRVHLFLRSICYLPDTLPGMDRIFCISTLEHMTPNARRQALLEFAKKLKPDGLIVLTMDYPLVPLEEFFESAEKAGLVPAGRVEFGAPPRNALYSDTAIPNGSLYVYRCVLKHRK